MTGFLLTPNKAVRSWGALFNGRQPHVLGQSPHQLGVSCALLPRYRASHGTEDCLALTRGAAGGDPDRAAPVERFLGSRPSTVGRSVHTRHALVFDLVSYVARCSFRCRVQGGARVLGRFPRVHRERLRSPMGRLIIPIVLMRAIETRNSRR